MTATLPLARLRESAKCFGRYLVRQYVRSPIRGKSRLRRLTDPLLSPAGHIEAVRVGPCVIHLDHRFHATRSMAYRAYEEKEIAMFRRLLRKGDVAVDVGANVGYLSAHMAELVGPEGKVYSFEPGPTPFASLLSVKESNRLANMEVFPIAVADQERRTIYYETENILDRGFGRIDIPPSDRHKHVHAHERDVTSLAAFFSARPVERLRLIKIDVEGHEKQVIEGLRGLLDRNVRPALVTEVTIRDQPSAELLEYRDILLTYGYQMFAIGNIRSRIDLASNLKNFHGNVAWMTD